MRLLGAKGGDGAGDLVSIFWDELDGVRRSRREGGRFSQCLLEPRYLRQVTLKNNDLQRKKPRTSFACAARVDFAHQRQSEKKGLSAFQRRLGVHSKSGPIASPEFGVFAAFQVFTLIAG